MQEKGTICQKVGHGIGKAGLRRNQATAKADVTMIESFLKL
jgi:hypothetical protein